MVVQVHGGSYSLQVLDGGEVDGVGQVGPGGHQIHAVQEMVLSLQIHQKGERPVISKSAID